MLDVKSFLSALKISWLKRILSDDDKLTKILQAICPLKSSIKERGGEFANIIMQRVKNPFGRMYLNTTKNCVENVCQ